MKKKRLTIGMSGASGAELCVYLLKALQQQEDWESHLVITDSALLTLEHEVGMNEQQLYELADHVYGRNEVGASIASGTFKTEGMVIIPCSMKTLAGVRTGYSDSLLLRAADVTLKERKKLVMVARETPLNSIHLDNMLTLSNMGVVMMPAMMTFYNQPETIRDMSLHLVGKVLNEFGLEMPGFRRWGSELCKPLPESK
ncbi:UbiX family flavin prenyltransferase [Endozoicomonadaceae bacterium StTr2]